MSPITAEVPSWEGPSSKVSDCARRISTIWAALEPIIYGRTANANQIVYDGVNKLKALETELFVTRAQIDKLADQQERHLQELTQVYESKLKEQHSEIEKLKGKLPDLESSSSPQETIRDPPNERKRSKRPDQLTNESKPVESQDEANAKSFIAEGRRTFESCDYAKAEMYFTEAQKYIHKGTSELRQKIDTDEVAYYLAVCAALDPKLDVTKRLDKLAEFLSNHANSPNLRPFQLAHANHLLSQLHIQLDDLESATQCCGKAFEYATRLPEGDHHRYEPTAILIRINELQGKNVDINNVIAQRFPGHWREWFRQKYSFLGPQGSEKQPSNPLRLQAPEGILQAPTWSAPRLHENVPSKPPEIPRRIINKATRKKWLETLELKVGSSFREAIVNSDTAAIEKLIKGLKRSEKPPETALHAAVLFGERKIAQALINAGSKVNQTCMVSRIVKTSEHRYSYSVTPMHVAIGAQQHDMINILKQNGASLGVPQKSGKNWVTAPPRFLLSEGWLKLIDCRDAKDVGQTIDLLVSLSWDINASLNDNGKTILGYAYSMTYNVSGFMQAVIKELENRGAQVQK